MNTLFKALGDPARREILDALRQKDGQTLSDLEPRFEMSRFGVMKHLGVLEEAGLITTLKRGRFKHHYLNPVPLQQALDRWIEPLLARPAARALIDLKAKLEGNAPMDPTPDLIATTYIVCGHDALWDALTRADLITRYHFATPHVDGDYAPGGTVTYRRPDGSAMLTCRVLGIDPKTRLETSFELVSSEGPARRSRCVYHVAATGDGMKLTIEHYDLGPGIEQTRDGWARFGSGLKSWLETGKTRPFALDFA
jgi:DNA-binding transcriptional ArsR family regulator/uncharacterized protein YndB with AHSA1/START domain